MLSICIIGSQARRTADALSDRDVLLVGAPSSDRDRSTRDWTFGGWNVSVFDRPAFGRLAEVRSLFVQHVKQEGRIVRDDGDFLRCALAVYTPKPQYLGERNDALRQIAELPKQNGRYWHDLCLADVTYVLFRNAMILHLASIGQYCFGYDDLLDRAAEYLCLTPKQIEALLNLRTLKHAYRQRALAVDLNAKVDLAHNTIAMISGRVGGRDASAVAAGTTTDEYLCLRLYELKLAATITPPVLDALKPEHDLFHVWRSMTMAGGYPKDKSFRVH